MSDEDLDLLLVPQSGLLANILLHHFTLGDWYLRDAPQADQRADKKSGRHGVQAMADPIGGLKMADDQVARVYRDGRRLYIDGAGIGEQVVFKNGVVALIDKVLSPDDVLEAYGCSPFVSEHSNVVALDSFDSLGAVINWVNVTHCQPYDKNGPKVDGSGFSFNAGRHDSSGPAGAFKNGLTDKQMVATVSYGDNEPSDLNFAWSADITVAIQGENLFCGDVRLGQGHSGSSNNWWIGQPQAYFCPSSLSGLAGIALNCATQSGSPMAIAVFPQQQSTPGAVNTFGVFAVPQGECTTF